MLYYAVKNVFYNIHGYHLPSYFLVILDIFLVDFEK
jgi:hypothetical protein